MKTLVLCLTTGFAVFVMSGQDTEKSVDARPDAKDLAKKAAEVLRHDVGVWDCEWRYLDATGNVTQTVKGVEKMTFALGEKLVEMTTEIPAGNVISKSMRFYNPVKQHITVLSVGADGNHWELNQKVGSDLMVSTPHTKPDGSVEHIRFRILEQKQNSMRVQMEMSADRKTWNCVFEQHMVRRTDSPRP